MLTSKVLWPPPSMTSVLVPTIDQAFKNQELLTNKMLELAAVPPGPYALFHHNAYVHEKMIDIKTIVNRLLENRKLLTELAHRENALRPKKRIRYGKPPSKRVQAVWQKNQKVMQQMKLDNESLFIFGNLLLDQWAHVIAYAVGYKQPELASFFRLADYLQKKGDKGLLQPLWDKHYNDILWLLYQIRNYRNIFIEHVREPWQRSTAMETYGNDFRLGSPAPVGWITEDEIKQAVNKIRYHAPHWARSTEIAWYTKHPRQLLEIIFFYIDEIKEKQHREDVWEAWKKVGGWTFSYDIIAFRLMRFISESMLTMLDIINKHPEKMNVGAAKTK